MTLQFSDALERAKLATDESGMLAPYTYNQLMEALPEEEKYPFTMALVELGIQTKWASFSKREQQDLRRFIDDESPEESELTAVASFAERLVKVAQQFVQSPGGLWMPSSLQEDETDTDEVEDVIDEYEVADEDIVGEEFIDEFSDYNDPGYVEGIRDVLEEEGISVDSEGNVSFYQANIPGIYTEQIPMTPMPLDLAYKRYYQSFSTAQKEQERVKGVLDAVSRMTPEMGDLLNTRDLLAEVKFSPKSKNKLVQSIAVGLNDLNQILVDPDWYKIQPMLDSLKSNLEIYVQQYMSQEENSYKVLDALDRLKDLQENDPERFSEAVGGYGALAAFRRMSQKYYPYNYNQLVKVLPEEGRYPYYSEEEGPDIRSSDKWDQFYEGDQPYIKIEIGEDYIKNRVRQENPAIQGVMLEEEVSEWMDFFKKYFMNISLDNPSYMEFCDDFEVTMVPGDKVEVFAEFFEYVPGENFDSYDISNEIADGIDLSFEGVYE